MADEQDSDKTEDPSAHRIEEFRRRGEVASSKDLTSILVLAGCILALGLSLVYIFETLSEFIDWTLKLNFRTAYSEKSLKTIVTKMASTGLKCVAPVFITSFCIGVLGTIMQIGVLFASEVLTLKLDRINPINGVKRLFSFKSVVEAIKGIFKFVVIAFSTYVYLKDDMAKLGGFMYLDLLNTFIYGKDMLVKLGFSMLTGLFIIALADFGYQKFSYFQKLKQTKQEAKQESKEQDGNPEVKQKIRAIQREMATKRMMTDIPTADAIITNPTHISVVIKYDQEEMVSPMLVGKGADHLAMRIREIAKEHDIPIIENVPLARSLYNSVKVGTPIPRGLYKAVAEVLVFVYKLKGNR